MSSPVEIIDNLWDTWVPLMYGNEHGLWHTERSQRNEGLNFQANQTYGLLGPSIMSTSPNNCNCHISDVAMCFYSCRVRLKLSSTDFLHIYHIETKET